MYHSIEHANETIESILTSCGSIEFGHKSGMHASKILERSYNTLEFHFAINRKV